MGLPLGDLEFVRVAGAVEVLFGLLVISGALPQACILIAGIPFNLTLWFFGSDELMGHLPDYAAMLVLLVYGSDPALRPAVSALWPFRRGRGDRRTAGTRRTRREGVAEASQRMVPVRSACATAPARWLTRSFS